MTAMNAHQVRESVRHYGDELLRLEAAARCLKGIRALSEQIRSLILTAPICSEPLFAEARCCAEMLNRLSRLKREAR